MFSSRLKHGNIIKKIGKLSVATSYSKIAGSKKINTVGILSIDGISRMINLQDLVTSQLGLRNPKIYSFRKFDKNLESSYKHFSENDFSWKGEITDSSLLSFLEQPFDLLICFYTEKNMYLEYTTLLSEAKFKVGFSGVYNKVFDIELSVSQLQEELFFTELYRYLKILNRI